MTAFLRARLTRLLAGAGLCIALTSGLLIGTDVPAADAYTAKASQLNICGAACHRPTSSQYRSNWGHDLLAFLVKLESPSPWAVMAEEVCGLEFLYLAQQFSSIGLQAQFFQTKSYDSTCQGSYGDALFTVGPNVGAPGTYAFSPSTYAPAVVPSEARQIGCQQKQSFGFTWYGCVIHTVDSSHGNPSAQAGEAAWVTGSIAQRIVGGDFNVTAPVNGWPSSWEADQTFAKTALFSTASDTVLENKIDLLFSPESWFPGSVGATSCSTAANRASTTTFTDHCYLVGSFSNPL